MSKPPKLDRKQLKQPDSFVSRGQSFLTWFLDHRARFLPVLGLILVAVAVSYGYDWYKTRQLDEAWRAYHSAMKLPEPQRWEDLKSVQSRFKNRASFFAAVTLADHFFLEAKKAAMKEDPTAAPSKAVVDNANLAIEWFGKASGFGELLPTEKQMLLVNRGNAAEMQKKVDEALADYQAAANLTGDGRALALLNLGRAYEMKNQMPKAAETYEKVAVDFSNSEYAKAARNASRRLKSPLFGNAPASAPKAE